ncbi:hypothetical protein ElyMa_006005200 [Elysia marginata]|uniref:Uncharacterized protein n=1 Tax=Elysia marginata TaxID=1093978 RepID=A0AAV4GHP6_9GAST|nr:hypothetical protein ElyMa_006005200 [Elysia marginata]
MTRTRIKDVEPKTSGRLTNTTHCRGGGDGKRPPSLAKKRTNVFQYHEKANLIPSNQNRNHTKSIDKSLHVPQINKNAKKTLEPLRKKKKGRDGHPEIIIAPPAFGEALERSQSSIETLNSRRESVSDSSSVSLNLNAGSGLYLKPPYILDGDSNISSLSVSRDCLASSAYDMIAFKFEENEPRQQTSIRSLGHSTAGDTLSVSQRRRQTLPEDLRDTCMGVRRGSSIMTSAFPQRTKLDFGGHRNPPPLTKEIDRYVLRAPQLYDSSIAAQIWGTSGAQKSSKPGVSFTEVDVESEVLRSVKQAEMPIPILRSVSSTRPQPSDPNIKYAATSPKEFPLKAASPRTSTDLTQPPSKDMAAISTEDFGAHPSELKVKITTGNTPKRDSRDMLAYKFSFAESRSIFRNQRIPTLRRSPAYIVSWTRPSGYTTAAISARNSLKGIGTPMGSSTSALTSTTVSRATVHEVWKDRLQQLRNIPVVVRLENGSFGYVRVDTIGLGSPRFYHWAPYNEKLIQDVRCRVKRSALWQSTPYLHRTQLCCIVPTVEESKPATTAKKKKIKPIRTRGARTSSAAKVEERIICPCDQKKGEPPLL